MVGPCLPGRSGKSLRSGHPVGFRLLSPSPLGTGARTPERVDRVRRPTPRAVRRPSPGEKCRGPPLGAEVLLRSPRLPVPPAGPGAMPEGSARPLSGVPRRPTLPVSSEGPGRPGPILWPTGRPRDVVTILAEPSVCAPPLVDPTNTGEKGMVWRGDRRQGV